MLFHEIEPFANAHIEVIDDIRSEIVELFKTEDNLTDAQRQLILSWSDKLSETRNGFVRFRVCMVDEVNQKFRAQEFARECRKNHR